MKPEGRLITQDVLTVCREGLGRYHRTSIFPCVIFQCMKGVNRQEGDSNYDLFKLALQSTSERLYPNYANCNFSCQKEWVTYDRNVRQDILDSLDDDTYNKLAERLIENPDLAKQLGVTVS